MKLFRFWLIFFIVYFLSYATRERMLGMLNLAYEELPDPLYYVIDDICSVLHCEAPNHKVIRYYSL